MGSSARLKARKSKSEASRASVRDWEETTGGRVVITEIINPTTCYLLLRVTTWYYYLVLPATICDDQDEQSHIWSQLSSLSTPMTSLERVDQRSGQILSKLLSLQLLQRVSIRWHSWCASYSKNLFIIRNVVRKKTGLCGKNSEVADPLPPPPS